MRSLGTNASMLQAYVRQWGGREGGGERSYDVLPKAASGNLPPHPTLPFLPPFYLQPTSLTCRLSLNPIPSYFVGPLLPLLQLNLTCHNVRH